MGNVITDNIVIASKLILLPCYSSELLICNQYVFRHRYNLVSFNLEYAVVELIINILSP